MKSLLRTAVASFVAALVINQDGGGANLIQGVQSLRIKSALQQHSASQLQDLHANGLEEAQLALIQSQVRQKSASKASNKLEVSTQSQQKTTAEADAKNQAQWGFLKNIVNIDRFFSSGVDDKKSSGFSQQSSKQQSLKQASMSQSNQAVNKQEQSTKDKQQKQKSSDNKLSQVKSKQSEDQEESELMKSSESDDSQADDAAAESAAAEVAKTDDQSTAQQQQEDKEVPIDDNSKTQTKEAEQTNETTISDSNQEQKTTAQAVVEQPAPAQPQPAQKDATQAALEQAQADVMKALNAQGKGQSTAEKEQAEQMIKQILEDVTKQAQMGANAGGAAAAGGKSEAEIKADLQTQQNNKEFLESQKTSYASKEEKNKHDDEVRNEGILKPKAKEEDQEVDLEIEAPGAANKVAEEGAQTPSSTDYQKLTAQIDEARKRPENKLGQGGFQINFKDPASFEQTMKVIVFNDANKNEKEIKVENFDTHDPAQTQTASLAMALSLQGDNGATIVDDQPGKESIIQNMNSDNAKLLSQISSGYSIRHDLVQKMAPGDKQFHMVSWDAAKKFNNMKTFQKRTEADKDYQALGELPKILISGETGDVLLANGEQSMIDQCLGMFYTQRYQGKYFGQP